MVHIATSLVFLVIGTLSLGLILAMLQQNQAPILSALAGRGAFPALPSPESGPSARMTFTLRSKKPATARRRDRRMAPQWSHAA